MPNEIEDWRSSLFVLGVFLNKNENDTFVFHKQWLTDILPPRSSLSPHLLISAAKGADRERISSHFLRFRSSSAAAGRRKATLPNWVNDINAAWTAKKGSIVESRRMPPPSSASLLSLEEIPWRRNYSSQNRFAWDVEIHHDEKTGKKPAVWQCQFRPYIVAKNVNFHMAGLSKNISDLKTFKCFHLAWCKTCDKTHW